MAELILLNVRCKERMRMLCVFFTKYIFLISLVRDGLGITLETVYAILLSSELMHPYFKDAFGRE